ncbi:MAG: hypothetical protein ICV60_02860 [Pyrinomonadaceae bacterium]|nr:hypothetical protein [Pyrinomonadaceae bacterium]
MPEAPTRIYVDNTLPASSDDNDGMDPGPRNPATGHGAVASADRAFSLLPSSWKGSAEIIFAPTNTPYEISTEAIYLGTPIGPGASSLVLRPGGDYPYRRILEVTALGGTADELVFNGTTQEDALMGGVLRRLTGDQVTGRVVSIRGNTGARGLSFPPEEQTIYLQRPMSPAVRMNESFAVEGPRVTLVPRRSLTITSHDGRSPNLRLIGIKIAPAPGAGLVFCNVRALCDTCEFYLQAITPPPMGSDVVPVLFQVHSDSRVQGGNVERHPTREQAGVYIHSNVRKNIVRAVRNGVLGGHLTFNNIIVQVSQGGWFVPKSLEARAAPIQILTGGAALAELSRENSGLYTGWGTESNKARVRDVESYDDQTREADGDGLRILNGGSINSPLGPINLDIYGCNRDGIRLDSGSFGFFGAPGGDTGLVTTGEPNRGFGMNVRNGGRAFVAPDVSTAPENRRLRGNQGELALEDIRVHRGWQGVTDSHPETSSRMSLVGFHH